jgi:hypothetical protein
MRPVSGHLMELSTAAELGRTERRPETARTKVFKRPRRAEGRCRRRENQRSSRRARPSRDSRSTPPQRSLDRLAALT